MSDAPCKGFWNMCGCPRCCAADRELEEDLTSGKKTFEQVADEFASYEGRQEVYDTPLTDAFWEVTRGKECISYRAVSANEAIEFCFQLETRLNAAEKQLGECTGGYETLERTLHAKERELEQLRVQLAGCGVAAMSNTRESLERARQVKPGDYGYSVSYADCLKTVEREIELREQLATLPSVSAAPQEGKADDTATTELLRPDNASYPSRAAANHVRDAELCTRCRLPLGKALNAFPHVPTEDGHRHEVCPPWVDTNADVRIGQPDLAEKARSVSAFLTANYNELSQPEARVISNTLLECATVLESPDQAQNNIRMLDAALRRVANALSDAGCGAGACGGVDTENEINHDTGKLFGPGGHTGYALEKAIRRLAARSDTPAPPAATDGFVRVWKNPGEIWSFLRSVLSQGGDIEVDYQNGKYKCYEEYSTRLDGAARERTKDLLAAPSPPASKAEGE